jgi:Ulp1 family protease catalytic subunit
LLRKLKEMAALPQDIEAQILPSPKLSILELLQHDLPIQHPKSLHGKIADFFDKNVPNETDPKIISKIPTPSQEVVLSLQMHLVNAIKNSDSEIMSIKCIHSIAADGMTYPLWIIAYWVKVGSVREIRDSWRKSEVYVRGCVQKWRKTNNTEGLLVVNQILDALAIVQWSEKLCGFSSNAEESLHSLTYYASSKWLRGDHANQMLDLLRKNLQRRHISNAEILSTYFLAKISQGFDDKDKYLNNNSFHYYRCIGDDLAAGISDQIAFLVNLDRNHWVSVIIDFRKQEILYGDSLGHAMTASTQRILTWWTRFHSNTIDNFTIKKLQITIQDDSFSCGLLAWNSLAVYLTGAKLLSANEVVEGWLKVMLDIVHEHESQKQASKKLIAYHRLFLKNTLGKRR